MNLRNAICLLSCAALLLASGLVMPSECCADQAASSVEGQHVSVCEEGALCVEYSVPFGKTSACYTGVCSGGQCLAHPKDDGTHLETRAVDSCRHETLVCRDGVAHVADQIAINEGGPCSTAREDFNPCTNPGCSGGYCISDHPARRPPDDSMECNSTVTTDCRRIPYRCVSGACVSRSPIFSGSDMSCDDIEDDKETCVVGHRCEGACTVRGCDANGTCVQDAPAFWYQTNGEVCGPPYESECKVISFLCQDGKCRESNTYKEGPCRTLSDGQPIKSGRCFKVPACRTGLCEQEVIEPCCGNAVVEAPGEDCDPGQDTPECQSCRLVRQGSPPLCGNGMVDGDEQCDPKAPHNPVPET